MRRAKRAAGGSEPRERPQRAGLYGGLLRLYPRDFREEYGEDMVLVLRRQLRDENAARVWVRTFLDLAITVPSLRLEAHMSRTPALHVFYGAASVACLVATFVLGSNYVVGTGGLIACALFATLAVLAWRRTRELGAVAQSAGWWRYGAAGAAGLGACIAVANVGEGALPDHTWYVWIGALLTSFVLMGVGLVLGITHAVCTRRTA